MTTQTPTTPTAGMTPQIAEALQRANVVRRHRSKLREELRELTFHEAMGELAAAIEQLPWWLESLEARRALVFVPRINITLADSWMERLDVHGPRELRRLSTRQRDLLIAMLRKGRLR